jgi:hypothetical protein
MFQELNIDISVRRGKNTNMLGIEMTYSPSSGRSSNVILFVPSTIVAAEFPRNLDLGRSSPAMTRLFSGEKNANAETGGWCETCSAT